MPSNGPDPATYITIRSLTIAIESNAINVAGTILQTGDPGVTIHGMPISLRYLVFVVGSGTEDLAPPQKAARTALPQQPPITIGDQTINVDSNAINIDGTALKPADPGTSIDGTLVSLISSSILVVGTHTQEIAFPQNIAVAAPSYISFGGNRIRLEDNKIALGGSTLSPGHPALTVNGKPISLGSSLLIVATQTTAFPSPNLTAGRSHISFAVQILTIASNELLLVGTTLTPGRSPVTANGTPISLGSSVLVLGTRTTSITLPTAFSSADPGGGGDIGTFILSDLSDIGGGTVVASTQTAGNNGTVNGNNGSVAFTDGAEKRVLPLKRQMAWICAVAIFMVWS
ncbi:hypothetical protein OEA41_010375 [Lepraria neglecta]|uniref:Uncharacterized protein n=1 Tax=Lepraria neglecta TaxID=209136 RepID=A0AAD9YWB1_9LECA|nr:hypothetical protein OEA41_010375 [Lepraria neglecta]